MLGIVKFCLFENSSLKKWEAIADRSQIVRPGSHHNRKKKILCSFSN